MRTLLPLLALVGCTTSRAVKPLPKGSGALTASIGGPMIADLGPTIPLPMTTVGGVYGVDGKTNVHGALHPTGLAAFRVLGASVGVARQLWDQQGASPRLMADATVSGFFGDAVNGGLAPSGRVFVDVSGVLSWDVGDHSLYTGLDLFLQPTSPEQPHLTPLVGAEIRRGRTGVALEAEWLAPYVDNRPLAARWWGPAHRGALQVQMGFTFRLGKMP